jgi:hypothetical protein
VENTAIQVKERSSIKERGQYAVAFGVVTVLLYVAGLPLFPLFFVGVISYFVWKIFASEYSNQSRKIFEFYLVTNEMLREDDRHWYGFEIKDAVDRGEAILREIKAPPPLVLFCLGALYQKLGDHSNAIKALSQVTGDNAFDEMAVIHPTPELRDYVAMLRKIERQPAEAPVTAAAVRTLERVRRKRGAQLLALSQAEVKNTTKPEASARQLESVVDVEAHSALEKGFDDHDMEHDEAADVRTSVGSSDGKERVSGVRRSAQRTDRKTISEVLHDIYDKNVQ